VGRLSLLYGQRGIQLNANGEIINPAVKTYGKSKNAKSHLNGTSSSTSALGNNENLVGHKEQEPTLALFVIACPFGPPSLFEMPQRESIFKTKHKINMTPLSLDTK
jgi:hypothetical protein